MIVNCNPELRFEVYMQTAGMIQIENCQIWGGNIYFNVSTAHKH